MHALNSELLFKLSSSQAGDPLHGDSGLLVHELREILASSKVGVSGGGAILGVGGAHLLLHVLKLSGSS